MAFGDFTVTRASTKNILGSAGLYVSVANNVPAFEFNTDGSYRGLLVEPGATNLALRSQEFDDAYWSKTDITVTANSIVAPDGATTADTITEGTANTALILGSATVSSGATATASVFIKAGSGNDFVRVMLRDTVTLGNRVETYFRFSTGALSNTANVGTGTGASASVQALPNGWFRVSISGAIPASAAYSIMVNSATAGGDANRVNNSVYYLWQAQLETGSVATSPIVTTAGTASRVADVVSLTGASSLIGQTEGTVYVEAEIGALLGIVVRNFLEVSDGSNTNRVFVNFTSAASNTLRAGTVANNVVQADFRQEVMSAGIFKFGYGYESTDSAFYFNGATTTEVSDNAFAFTAPVSQINIGSGQAGTSQAIAWIRSVALFPTRLDNATLASLTTP
jgi:hypothetical protein